MLVGTVFRFPQTGGPLEESPRANKTLTFTKHGHLEDMRKAIPPLDLLEVKPAFPAPCRPDMRGFRAGKNPKPPKLLAWIEPFRAEKGPENSLVTGYDLLGWHEVCIAGL